ncbi:Major Facilitator Superfamily (MFS) transporter [Phytophthora megakarya]|uniref:Major Facilitator Superfamily (MFS) transporter n=1 Tax=Phytophthora megakarya TaxID=4795 RepID=A0A225VYF5_9STRA|nr:Major Facilitator Superfamily (MFS) transporter [Phytophthora megakarya]
MRCRLTFLLDAGEAKELISLKMLFVIHNYCYSLVAYLPIFFEESNFSKSEIGILLAIPCICTIIGPPVWGAIADTLHRHKQVLILCHVTSAVFIFAIQFVKSFPLMCITVFAAYCQMVPTLALLDLAAMKLTGRYGGDFGKQRLYGALGYGVGGYISGMMASAIGIEWCFTMMLCVSCITLILLIRYIPAGYGDDDQHPHQKGLLRASVNHICKRPDVLVLFVIALVLGVNGGFIDSYLFLNVYDLSDDGSTIVSVFVAVQTLSEIPLFFLASTLNERFGTALCLVIAVAAFFTRDMVYIYMEQPWYIVPLETLHGITFGLLLATLTTYLYEASPKGAAGTMIGLLSAFMRGIGAGIASLTGGYIYDEYGVETVWKVGAYAIVPAVLVLIGIFAWLARRHQTPNVDLEENLVEQVSPLTDCRKSLSVE